MDGETGRPTDGQTDEQSDQHVLIDFTEEPKLLDVQHPKRVTPPAPPTAQTPGPIWLIFCLKVPCGYTFGIAVGIFPFPPRG